MGNRLDAGVQASLDLISNLSKRFNFFINGDGVMATDSGPVESINRIAKRLSSTGYFHPITEFRTVDEMLAAGLPQDSMGYVRADANPAANGLYTVTENNGLQKASYESIVNLSNERGRDLLIKDRVVTPVTGQVEFYQVVVPHNVEQTIWVRLKMMAYHVPSQRALTRDATVMLRCTGDYMEPIYWDLIEDEAKDSAHGEYTAKAPHIDVNLTTQNDETQDANTLVTIAIGPPNGEDDENYLITLSALDSSCLIYPAELIRPS